MKRAFATSAVALKHKSPVATRFPTRYNPVRSAYKQEILLPEGVVYNPPPAAPTPYETPAAFLPVEDSRSFRKDAHEYPVDRMPVVNQPPRRTSHLTAEDCAEIQRLRHSEPFKWTRKALAERFGVSQYVIGLVSTPHPEHKAEMDRRLDMIKGMWNDKRARARMHRQWRQSLALRDA